jgi:hypothetical protein
MVRRNIPFAIAAGFHATPWFTLLAGSEIRGLGKGLAKVREIAMVSGRWP